MPSLTILLIIAPLINYLPPLSIFVESIVQVIFHEFLLVSLLGPKSLNDVHVFIL